jgi:D-aminopeptidase
MRKPGAKEPFSIELTPMGIPVSGTQRLRARQLGLEVGFYRTGKQNAITDVPGVLVGHSTVIHGSGKRGSKRGGPARTGVTAIRPNEGNIFMNRLVGGSFVLNGAGEVSGLTQVAEWGQIESPILLTNTLSVGTVSEATVRYLIRKYPGIGSEHDVVIPLVGECDDSYLNDIAAHHVQEKHVIEALNNASGGPVEEGCVGGGTGMVTCDFKAGIGTSSRKLSAEQGSYTVGALVMSNFGHLRDLKMAGLPIGDLLSPYYAHLPKRTKSYGSIIVIIGTDAPCSSRQLNRLSKRAALGIGRVGSFAAHGSGEIVLSFSTANTIPRISEKLVYNMKMLVDNAMNPLYAAVVEATEEAILNSICMANEMEGINGNVVPALPLPLVKEIITKYNAQKRTVLQF